MSIVWATSPLADAADAPDLWRRGEVLASCETSIIERFPALVAARDPEPFERKPRGPWFRGELSADVRAELERLRRELEIVFGLLYEPLGPPIQTNFTWRPTETRGEMHTDRGTPDRVGGKEERIITAFVNLDTEPRVWRLGSKEIAWPPGAVWIFRAEKVPHQVVRGRCCVQYNWVLM